MGCAAGAGRVTPNQVKVARKLLGWGIPRSSVSCVRG